MIRYFVFILTFVFSTTAFAVQEYCEVESNEEFVTHIVRIPYGIAILTEESPYYCEVKTMGLDDHLGCDNHPEDGIEIRFQMIDGVENVFVGSNRFEACERDRFHDLDGNYLSDNE